MNFFEHQMDARKSSSRLVMLFVAAVICIVIALYFVFASISVFSDEADGIRTSWWIPELFFWTLACTVGVVGLTSLMKISSLSAGGSTVAEWMGGRLIDPGTKNKHERKLVNVVEEMAIASGVPVPSIYVINEQGINAFAAGYSADDAAVAVTVGCMRELSRDELQGVIAHEFSHILNGDMKLNIRLIGVLAGILVIGVTGAWVLRIAAHTGSGSKKEGAGAAIAMMVFGLSLMVIGYVGVFFGNIIKSAVSRQREYLADASAVQFTRNPNGIGGALRKILGFAHGSQVEHQGSAELSHMFFANSLSGGFFSGMFATHPPLEERIERIAGVGAMQSGVLPTAEKSRAASASPARESAPDGAGGMSAGMAAGMAAGLAAGASANVQLNPNAVMEQVGMPTEQHIALGAQLIGSIPPEIRDSTGCSLGAVAVVYGVLLDEDTDVRKIQLNHLASNADRGVCVELKKRLPLFKGLDPRLRLVLIDLSVPALRQLTRAQFAEMRTNVEVLVHADEKVTLFEYCLEKTIEVSLEANFNPAKKGPSYGKFAAVAAETAVVLSALAHAGQDSIEEAQSAFQKGLARLPENVRGSMTLQPEEAGFRQLDASLNRVSRALPGIKEKILDACVHVALADESVTLDEGEMLRAVAHVMGCPVPPFLSN